MDEVVMDREPRYVPDRIAGFSGRHIVHARVTGSVFHPPGAHDGPIRKDTGALEVKTAEGSRWFGVESAYINSELRMVAVGFPAAFEEMSHWQKMPADRLV